MVTKFVAHEKSDHVGNYNDDIMRIDTKKNDSNHENSDNSDITTCTR